MKPFCLQKMFAVITFASDVCFEQGDTCQRELERYTAVGGVGSLGCYHLRHSWEFFPYPQYEHLNKQSLI
jgi:hypothetical protein